MSKYHAMKVTCGGITFDSQKEYRRWRELSMLEQAGKITHLQRQVKYILIPKQVAEGEGVYQRGKKKGQPKPGKVLEYECAYIADFRYIEDGKVVVEDVKGMKTKEYIIKRKLMLYEHGIRIREV